MDVSQIASVVMVDAARFREELLDFINVRLPRIHASRRPGRVEASTPLFDPGPIDSLGILHLIEFIESATGRKITTRMVTLDHFRTVDAICESVCGADTTVAAAAR